jgi:AbrB family looped-hinge helix DNA binding protein
MSETGLAEVRKYGVITIPKTIRDALGIKEGDVVRITVEKVEKSKAIA